MSLYLNGVLEQQVAAPAEPRRITQQPFYIGRRTDCCYLDGNIDELRVYDRALSLGEISALASR